MARQDISLTLDSDGDGHAFDPVTQPGLFQGVIGRRVSAFLIDVTIIFFLWLAALVLVFIAGIFTLGLTWLLFGAVFPIVALAYNAWTLSRPASATIGMRVMGLEMRTWDGERMYAVLAAFHALLFYFTVTMLTPFILLVAPFTPRKRCLHDFLAGVLVINSTPAIR